MIPVSDKEKSDWPVLILLFVGLPLAFTYGGFWVGLLVLVVGIIALGWSKRHEGPFPTNKGK
jgi:hypothetical protein